MQTLQFHPQRVLHPTDFSDESKVAFEHALAISLADAGSLTILHVAEDHKAGAEWELFPSIRETLIRWGKLEENSDRSEVFARLGVKVEKIDVDARRPLSAIVEHVDEHDIDLIVLATHARDGLPRLLHRSVAEPLARRSRTTTLFVRTGARSFVSNDGRIVLRRLLAPIDVSPSPNLAARIAAGMARLMQHEAVEILLLHVGGNFPEVTLPDGQKCTWTNIMREGDVVAEILAVAHEQDVDAIVMATHGHEGILDALRGNTTEQVLRHARCPVLAAPAF